MLYLKKQGKTSGDIIIVHMCTKNFDKMIPKNQNNQNFEKNEKNDWRYHHFTNVQQKPQSLEYGS